MTRPRARPLAQRGDERERGRPRRLVREDDAARTECRAGDGMLELRDDEALELVEGELAREARCLRVAAAVALARDHRDVDLVHRGPQRDAVQRPVPARRLPDQRRDHRSFDGAQVVDDPLRVRLGCPDLGEVVLPQVRDDEPAARVHLRPLERAREELQLRELDVLVDGLEDLVPVGAGLDQVGREPKRLRARVRVLEASGVGDERDVERLGDLGRDLDAEVGEEVGHDLARRGRVGDDQVDVAEARVVVVMVDVDRERRALEDRGIGPEALLLRAVDGEEHALRVVGRRLAMDAVELEKRVLARKRSLARDEHLAVLPQLPQGEVRREKRPERVTVRVLVRRDEEAVVVPDGGRHRVPVSRRGGHRGSLSEDPAERARRSACRVSRPARPSDRMRT